jgi:hypothetical protein
VTAARAIYSGPRNPVTGRQIYPGLVRGSEADGQFGWVGMDTQVETPFGVALQVGLRPDLHVPELRLRQ